VVLVVDDTPSDRLLVSSLVESMGFEVASASSGQEAFMSCLARLPRLILLDVVMDGLGGHELCRRLKADERTRAVPVIFVSAQGNTDDVLAGFEAGGVDYVCKPIYPAELKARVRAHVELALAREELRELREFLPICSYCRRVRGARGEWVTLERYLHEHSSTRPSHGICSDCARDHFAEDDTEG
jgi:DNA-binding response OmpR family regulator